MSVPLSPDVGVEWTDRDPVAGNRRYRRVRPRGRPSKVSPSQTERSVSGSRGRRSSRRFKPPLSWKSCLPLLVCPFNVTEEGTDSRRHSSPRESEGDRTFGLHPTETDRATNTKHMIREGGPNGKEDNEVRRRHSRQ